MKKYLCLCAVYVLLVFQVSAQTTAGEAETPPASTADEIEALLNTRAVTWAQAARFVLKAADVTAAEDPEQAFRYAAERSWLPKNAAAHEAARLDGIALLVMRSFDIGGGIFFSLAKNPHYAYREMTYRDILQGRIDPAMPVSGDILLYVCNRILSQREEDGQP